MQRLIELNMKFKRRILFLRFVIFFMMTSFITASLAQETIKFLQNDGLNDFIIACDNNDQKAINELLSFALPDTITINELWYDESLGRGIPVIMKSSMLDEYYASLKIKSFSWILRIYSGRYDSDTLLYVFRDDNSVPVYDYELIKPVIIDTSSFPKKILVDVRFSRKQSDGLNEIENLLIQWGEMMNSFGLNYLKLNKIPPVPDSLYNIVEKKEWY